MKKDYISVRTRSKQPEAEFVKGEISSYLDKEIGLELSDEKTLGLSSLRIETKITHISDGFDFLGFNIRKYHKKSPKSKFHTIGKLLIKPQKEKVLKVTRKMQETLDNNKTAKQMSIISTLNPIIQGYGLSAVGTGRHV